MLKLTRKILVLWNNVKSRFCSAPDETINHPQDINQASKIQGSYVKQAPSSQYSRSPDGVFRVSSVSKLKNLSQVHQAHAWIIVNGLSQDLSAANKILHSYSLHRATNSAYALFCRIKDKNSVSWSVMIGGFAKAGDHVNCFGTLRQYMRSMSGPDNYTLPLVIRVCRDRMDLPTGKMMHDVVCKYGFGSYVIIASTLLDMYAKCKAIDDARVLFDEMPSRDLVTWTVMIGAYAECGNPQEALGLFDRMRDKGIVPDKIAMVNVANACSKLGATRKAKIVDEYVRSKRRLSIDAITGTSLIDMHAKCGSIELAREVFDSMLEKNVITWSSMIAAHGYHGEGNKALELFHMMLEQGVTPNAVTFVSLLYACSHSGLVDEGLRVFSIMEIEHKISPDVKHFTCVVDLLGRAGKLERAWKLIEETKIEKDAGLWGAFLGACRIHGKFELAEKAAESLLELQPQNAGHYVCLSNIYAKAGKWKEVAKVREVMNNQRVKKVPGWTWIEIEDKIHRFTVGDRTHSCSKEIYEELRLLGKKLELAGYVPNTNFVLHDVEEEIKVGDLSTHSEKLAIAFGLKRTREGTPIRITKNLRVCGDCHEFAKFVSLVRNRVLFVRDANRFHRFEDGVCSCRDYW